MTIFKVLMFTCFAFIFISCTVENHNVAIENCNLSNPNKTNPVVISNCSGRSTYSSVTIGTQVWMGENLDVCTYRNNDPIPQVTDPTQWNNLTTGAWCYYNNDSTMGAIYGKLYNWYAVNDPRVLAPTGWHVSTDAEWTGLEAFLGGSLVAGGKLKSTGTIVAGNGLWLSPNTGASNSSGFSALPDGYRDYDGSYNLVGYDGSWWSSLQSAASNAWYWTMHSDYNGIYRGSWDKRVGFSVRCVRD